MNNDKEQTIYDFDFSLVCEYFSSLERQGPGSEEMTKLALSFIDGLTEESKIADLGCGTGGQTATLAQNTKASITALDLFPAFIDKLQNRFANLKQSDRVSGIVGSMNELPFADREFDVIWCEGAIYNIGFKHGLEYWHKFIKSGGYIAVTEASWFTENRPEEIHRFWNEAYPEIDTILIRFSRFSLQDIFRLPISSCLRSAGQIISIFFKRKHRRSFYPSIQITLLQPT